MRILLFDTAADHYVFELDGLEAAVHAHPLREEVRALRGTFDAEVDGRPLRAQTTVTIPAHIPHAIRAAPSTRLQVEMTASLPTEIDGRVAAACQTIREGYACAKPVTTQLLAARAHLSPSRFAALFRAEVGLSVGRFANFERLKAIVRMHLDTGATLTAAAHAYDLYDAAHLNRLFRTYFGVAPTVGYNSATVRAPNNSGT